MFDSSTTIDILDRKYNFLKNCPDDIFFLELKHFVEFLSSDERFREYTNLLINEWYLDAGQRYQNQRDETKKLAEKLKGKFVNLYPDLNDSTYKFPKKPDKPEGINKQYLTELRIYDSTFSRFDDIIKSINRDRGQSCSLHPDIYEDESDAAVLLGILRGKIFKLEENRREIDKSFFIEFKNLEERYDFAFKEYKNSSRSSPGWSLSNLLSIFESINPKPKNYLNWEDFVCKQTDVKIFVSASFVSAVQGFVYNFENCDKKALKEVRENSELHLTRVFEAVREKIGTYLSHYQLINKYKERCMRYITDDIRRKILRTDETFIKNCEDVLAKDLALYLFDNGISTIYRVRFGKHEIDILDHKSKAPLVIETKAYKNNNARKDLVNGVAQLHSYLNNLRSDYAVEEAFYIIFRVNGPLYEFPEKISTNQFTIFPVLIDIASSKVSGRNQPKPIYIPLDELFKNIK
jgi:hypothetical protein